MIGMIINLGGCMLERKKKLLYHSVFFLDKLLYHSVSYACKLLVMLVIYLVTCYQAL